MTLAKIAKNAKFGILKFRNFFLGELGESPFRLRKTVTNSPFLA